MWQCLTEAADERGLISFSEFMEQALYGPFGYYQQRVQLGGAGSDFYTSAQFPLFGMTLGRYISQLYQAQERTGPLRIVELGPGQGELAYHVCSYLLSDDAIPEGIDYFFVERSLRLKQVQEETTRPISDKVRFSWLDDNTSFTADHVFVLSNELLDALPVERVKRVDSGVLRGFVRLDKENGNLQEVFLPAPAQLSDLVTRYAPVPPSHVAEICLHYDEVFERLSVLAHEVDAVFFDYGTYRQEWQEGVRPHGTLRAFHHHELVDPLEHPGEVDITADVNWDLAHDVAEKNGFVVTDISSQGSFLMRNGIMDVVAMLSTDDGLSQPAGTSVLFSGTGSTALTRALKQLVMPGGMGERFSAFVFQKRGGSEKQKC